jgi:hypothetical protein
MAGLLELDSSTSAKFSRHLLVRLPRHAFASNACVGALLAHMRGLPQFQQLQVAREDGAGGAAPSEGREGGGMGGRRKGAPACHPRACCVLVGGWAGRPSVRLWAAAVGSPPPHPPPPTHTHQSVQLRRHRRGRRWPVCRAALCAALAQEQAPQAGLGGADGAGAGARCHQHATRPAALVADTPPPRCRLRVVRGPRRVQPQPRPAHPVEQQGRQGRGAAADRALRHGGAHGCAGRQAGPVQGGVLGGQARYLQGQARYLLLASICWAAA